MIFFFCISVTVLLFGVPFTEGRLSKIPKRYDSNANRLQTNARDEYLKLDSTGMLSDSSDLLSSFNLNIPTESALNILSPSEGRTSSKTAPINEQRPGIGVSFITTTGVGNRSGENIFSPAINKEDKKPFNKIDLSFDKKEGKEKKFKTKEKNDTVKTLIAKKILFQAKPVVPENELDDAKTDTIYYIE